MKETTYALRGATLFDGQNFRAARHTIVIDKGLISQVCEGDMEVEGARTVNVRGRTVMPGMIDAHYHCNAPSLDIWSADHMPPSQLAQHARKYLEDSLLRGFTTIRDAGGADLGLVTATEQGLIKGPRLYISGKALSQTGGHGDMRPAQWAGMCGCAYHGSISQLVDGPEQMRVAVRRELKNGAHQIKLFVSGGVISPTDPLWMNQFNDAEIRVAVEETARWRTYVMAHAHTAAAARRCVELGVRSIEHGTQIDRETAGYIAESETFVVPTLSIIDGLINGPVELPAALKEKAKYTYDQAFRAVEHCVKAGVKLGLGSDLLGELHDRESTELKFRTAIAGSLATLRSATSGNAEMMGMAGQLGAIKEGAFADLLVVDGNPVDNIDLLLNPTRNIPLIMKAGAIVVNTLE